jgi:putative ABC transport system ATP-binding protein
MEKEGIPSLDQPGGRFSAEAAIVLLTALILIESISIIGWSTSLTSSFQPPLAKSLSLLVCVISFVGAFGLYKKRSFGTYLSLSASAFWATLGGLAFLRAGITGQTVEPWQIHGVAALVFGPLVVLSVWRLSNEQTSENGDPKGFSSSIAHGSPPKESRSSIETMNVKKKYFVGDNVVSAIDDISMQVKKGEFVAIMGPSGSGKSTLLNLLGALDKPFSGRVLIDGVDISKLDETGLAELRNEKIGFVFQAYNLIGRSTVMRNMELPAYVRGFSREERLKRIKNLLAIVGLGDKLLRKPKTLSGGEQQRVAIARALVNSPEIVLADEPTGNVDSKQGRIIMKFLRKLNLQERRTIIVVTHDPEVARMADRIVYIRDGQISEEKVVGGFSG